MKLVIVHDAVGSSSRADERDVLTQGQCVAGALTELGHHVQLLAVSLDLDAFEGEIVRSKPDLVFNLVESLGGHGRLIHVIPGLLDAIGIPYTGAGADAQFTTSNKLVAKQLLCGAGLPTPAWISDHQSTNDDQFPAGRYIVKSVWEHASIGLDEDSVVTVDHQFGLQQAIDARLHKLGGQGFAEAYIDGREFNLALLADDAGPQVLPPAEIVFDGFEASRPKVVGYRAKWDEDAFEYRHTPRRYDFPATDEPLIAGLRSLARRCWEIFSLRGHARVDFRVDRSGAPFILEINTNPCLSPDAGFAAALDRAGIPFAAAVGRIVNDSFRPRARQTKAELSEVSAAASCV
jgi:D-alanine-D-alanine ligase